MSKDNSNLLRGARLSLVHWQELKDTTVQEKRRVYEKICKEEELELGGNLCFLCDFTGCKECLNWGNPDKDCYSDGSEYLSAMWAKSTKPMIDFLTSEIARLEKENGN